MFGNFFKRKPAADERKGHPKPTPMELEEFQGFLKEAKVPLDDLARLVPSDEEWEEIREEDNKIVLATYCSVWMSILKHYDDRISPELRERLKQGIANLETWCLPAVAEVMLKNLGNYVAKMERRGWVAPWTLWGLNRDLAEMRRAAELYDEPFHTRLVKQADAIKARLESLKR